MILAHSGLVIDADHGWLACSPDDLVQDNSSIVDKYGLVEYKCPYSCLLLNELDHLKTTTHSILFSAGTSLTSNLGTLDDKHCLNTFLKLR